MELQISHEEGLVLARTAGPIDDSAKDLFRQLLHPLVAERGTKVVLDLSQSNFVNSNGLGHLVALAANANTNSSRVILAACSPFVSVVLERSKLNRYFELSETVSAAIRALLP